LAETGEIHKLYTLRTNTESQTSDAHHRLMPHRMGARHNNWILLMWIVMQIQDL